MVYLPTNVSPSQKRKEKVNKYVFVYTIAHLFILSMFKCAFYAYFFFQLNNMAEGRPTKKCKF